MNTQYQPHGTPKTVNYAVQPYNTKVVFKFLNDATEAKANNNVWRSKFLGDNVDIEFSEFWDLTGSFTWCHGDSGIYALYLIPDHMRRKVNTLPVINEYMIYIGETDTSLATRIYKFRTALSTLIRQYNDDPSAPDTVGHAAADKFFAVMKSKIYCDCDGKFDSIQGFTVMARVARKSRHYHYENRAWTTPDWKYGTADHERALMAEVRKVYPGILYNTN